MAQGKSDGTVYIDTRVDTKGFGKGMNSMKSQVGGLTGAFKKLGIAISAAFAIKQLIKFGQKAVELGSDLQEVQNVVDTVFTSMSDNVEEFAKSAAESAGLSETMAKRYVGTFGAMAKAFGFAENEAFTMSTALTQLAGDVASFYNITQDEAYTKLKSVFSGETETLKDLGIVMTQNALDSFAMAEGLGKTTKEMTEQEKVALRYRFVMNQLSSASGDFLRTSDSWANQVRLLRLNIESIMATFGQALINFFTPIIKLINTMLSKIATLANSFKAFSDMIMGTSSGGGGSGIGQTTTAIGELSDGYNEATEGAENLADATEKANKANKKYLTGLDEIKTFQTSKDGIGSLSIGSISGEPVDFGKIDKDAEKTNTVFDGIIDKVKELAGIFKDGFFDGLGDFETRLKTIKDGFNSIKKSIIDIFSDSGVKRAMNRFINSFTYSLGQIIGSLASIGLTLGANLVGGLSKYLNENSDRIKGYLTNMFNIGADISEMFGNYLASIAYIFESFASENGQQITADLIAIFANAVMGITEIMAQLGRDVIALFTTPIINGKEQIKLALDDLLAGFVYVTSAIKDYINDMVEFGKDVYNTIVSPIFSSLTEKLTSLVQDHISPAISKVGDLFRAIGEALSSFWNSVLQPFISWFINNVLPTILPALETIVRNFTDTISIIVDLLSGLIGTLTGLIDFLTGVFTGDWQKAWDGVKNIVGSIWDSITGIVKTAIDNLKDWVSDLLSLFDKTSSKASKLGSKGSGYSRYSSIYVPYFGNYSSVNIPKLASGSVIPPNAPFLAMLGDQRHGTNIEAPLDTIKQAVREVVGNGNNGTIHAHLYLDGKEVLTSIIDMAKLEQTSTGINPLLLT